jgi:hypothetical protein
MSSSRQRDEYLQMDLPFAPLTLDECSLPVIARAIVLVNLPDGVVGDPDDTDAWLVVSSSDPVVHHRVQFGRDADSVPTWVTCTCPYGSRRATGRIGCSHAAAAFTALEKIVREP